MRRTPDSYLPNGGKPFTRKTAVSMPFPSFRDFSGTQNGTAGGETLKPSVFDPFSDTGRTRKQDTAPTVTAVPTETKPFGRETDSFTTAHTESDPFEVKKNPSSASYTEAGSSPFGGLDSGRNTRSRKQSGETGYSMNLGSNRQDWTDTSIPMFKPARSKSPEFRQDDFLRGFNWDTDPWFQTPKGNNVTRTNNTFTVPSTQWEEMRQNRNPVNQADAFLLGFQDDGLNTSTRTQNAWSDTGSNRRQMLAYEEVEEDEVQLLSYNEPKPSTQKRNKELTPDKLVDDLLHCEFPAEKEMEALGIDLPYVCNLCDDLNNHRISKQEAIDKVTRDVNGSNSRSNSYKEKQLYHTPDVGYQAKDNHSSGSYEKYNVPVIVEELYNGYLPDDEELTFLGITREQGSELIRLLDNGFISQSEMVERLNEYIARRNHYTSNYEPEQYNTISVVYHDNMIPDYPTTHEGMTEYADSLMKSILSGVVPEEELEGLGVDSSALNRLLSGLANGTITGENAVWQILKSYSGLYGSSGRSDEIMENPSGDSYGVSQMSYASGTDGSGGTGQSSTQNHVPVFTPNSSYDWQYRPYTPNLPDFNLDFSYPGSDYRPWEIDWDGIDWNAVIGWLREQNENRIASRNAWLNAQFERSGAVFSAIAKKIASDLTGLMTFLYDSGQNARTNMNREYLAQYEEELEHAKKELDEMLEDNSNMPNYHSQNSINAQIYAVVLASTKVNSMRQIIEGNVQEESTKVAYILGSDLAQSADEDLEKAKRDYGAFGRFAIDVGVGVARRASENAIARVIGTGAIVVAASTTFGEGIIESTTSGVDYKNSALYAAERSAANLALEHVKNNMSSIVSAFKENFSEDKLGAMIIHVTEWLEKGQIGRAALSGLEEGGKELVEGIIKPILQQAVYDKKSIYDVEKGVESALTAMVVEIIVFFINSTYQALKSL